MSTMRSVLLFSTLLALSGLTFAFPHEKEDALIEDMFRVSMQDNDDEGGKADMEALNALINAYSSTQEEDDGGDDNAKIEGFVSRLGKIFRFLKKAGNVLHSNFGNNPVVRKYSKYLRCLPSFQEQLELVTTQEDDDKAFEKLLSNLEAQAQSEGDTAKVQFFKKLWRKAKRFGRKALKVIRAVKRYLRCIRRSIEAQSEEEMQQVEQQAMHVLQKAITGRVVRL